MPTEAGPGWGGILEGHAFLQRSIDMPSLPQKRCFNSVARTKGYEFTVAELQAKLLHELSVVLRIEDGNSFGREKIPRTAIPADSFHEIVLRSDTSNQNPRYRRALTVFEQLCDAPGTSGMGHDPITHLSINQSPEIWSVGKILHQPPDVFAPRS